MKTYKTYIECCRDYTSKKRKWNRRVQVAIIILVALCAGAFFINKWIAIASAVVAVLAEILQKLLPQLNQPEEELLKLDNIASGFENTLIELESLWNNHKGGKINDEQANKLLSKYNIAQTANKSEMNKLVRKFSPKEESRYQEKTDKYLIGKFYQNE